MTRLRVRIVTVAFAMGIVAQARAQTDTARSLLCWRARPASGCRAFALTNFGVYVSSDERQYEGRLRALADWGLMINLTAHDAIGASFFLSLDNGSNWRSGPTVRYRRWTGPRSALDLAVGRRGPTPDDQGAVFGLVKYSPTPLIGLALRPEFVSRRCPVGLCCLCNQTGWVPTWRVLVGAELAEEPGFVVPVAGAAVGGLIYALIPKRIM